ncbi:MAG: lysophospholipid acyltransferase family protein [Candidatus Izemoplasmatales bacterium]
MQIKDSFFKLILMVFYHSKFKFQVNYGDFNPKRTDPYFLIGNHASLHDGLYTATFLKRYPYPVINAFMFIHKSMKFVLKKLIYSIPKRKGQSDISTIMEMMKVVKKGRGIMLFPEGNSSYFGKESQIPYATVKLFKKFKIDVVICKTNGAYLSAPRWGDKSTHKGLMQLNFKVLFKAEELENYSLDEMYDILTKELAFNDFDWNKQRKYLYKPKYRALGLENYIYVCPKCLSYQTISTNKNDIQCNRCGKIAHFNQYSLIEGLDFDNLVDWDLLQKRQLPNILKEEVHSQGLMYLVDTMKYKSYKLGHVKTKIDKGSLFAKTDKETYHFNILDISGLTLTKKNEVSFDYDQKTYLFVLKDPMLYVDLIHYIKENKGNG